MLSKYIKKKNSRELVNDVGINEITIRKGMIKYNNLETLKNYESKLAIYINEFFVKKESVYKLIPSYFEFCI